MRYSLIYFSIDPRGNYQYIGCNDIEVSHTILKREKKLFDIDGLKIALVGEVIRRIYIPEEHPLFNLYTLIQEFDSIPQYEIIKDQISKTFGKIITPLVNNEILRDTSS